MPSRVTSPNVSDSEDGGDYEHVLGFLPSDAVETPLRSLRGSYADLQQLKTAPSTTLGINSRSADGETSPTDGFGIHHRHGHRERRESLTDGVPVERIGALNRVETFKEATEDLNKENTQRRHGDE